MDFNKLKLLIKPFEGTDIATAEKKLISFIAFERLT